MIVPLDKKKADAKNVTLVECGPRFCLNPIKIFAGSFGGATLYENSNFVSPNTIRALRKKQAAGKYKNKVAAESKRRQHVAAHPMPVNELDTLFNE